MTLIFMSIFIFISILMMMAGIMISKNSPQDKEKISPFECGFNPMFKARIPFSMHFFLIALIFVIFDIEIILLIPASLAHPSINLASSLIIFIFILGGGLFHEWAQQSLSWA